MDNGKLGKFLAELRREKGLTQEKLAELIDCDNKTISKWETGVYTPPIQYLTKLSDLYDISIMEIMQCDRKKTTNKNEKEKNESIIRIVNSYNKTAKRNVFIKSIIVILLLITIFIISIYFMKKNEWHVIVIDDNDKNETYVVKGSIIYNNKKTLFNINEISYSSNTSGTEEELLIDEIEVSLYANEALVINKKLAFDTPISIEEAMNDIYFYESIEKHLDIKQEVKIIVEYMTSNQEKTDIIMLLNGESLK